MLKLPAMRFKPMASTLLPALAGCGLHEREAVETICRGLHTAFSQTAYERLIEDEEFPLLLHCTPSRYDALERNHDGSLTLQPRRQVVSL